VRHVKEMDRGWKRSKALDHLKKKRTKGGVTTIKKSPTNAEEKELVVQRKKDFAGGDDSLSGPEEGRSLTFILYGGGKKGTNAGKGGGTIQCGAEGEYFCKVVKYREEKAA